MCKLNFALQLASARILQQLSIVLYTLLFRYREQAAKDAEAVHRHAQLILKERGWSCDLVNENDIKLFCKHAAELRLIRGSSLAAELLDARQLPGEIDISNQFPFQISRFFSATMTRYFFR